MSTVGQDQAGDGSLAAPKRSNVIKIVQWGDSPPKIICLCGSTRYKNEFLSAARAFTLSGHIIVMPGVFAHVDGIGIDAEEKKMLDELHFKKIEMSDIVYIINPRGYIGESTKREIEYAESLGKMIRYLDQP